jgi:predicted metal-dependent enzyme (double-stranded beta helix superfamily)
MKLGLPQFAAALREIREEEFTAAKLNPILQNLDLAAASVDRYVKWRPGKYTRNLVHANPNFELMVLCWDPGSISSIHDHSGQQCWFVAHSGRFVVENYDLLSGGGRPGQARLRATAVENDVTVGMPDYRAPDVNEIHRVSVPKDAGRAVSIHIYAKPFNTCMTFDEQAQRCEDKPMFFDNVEIERIFLASA